MRTLRIALADMLGFFCLPLFFLLFIWIKLVSAIDLRFEFWLDLKSGDK